MAQKKFIKVSGEKKADLLKQLLLLARTAEAFSSDRKMLKALCSALKRFAKKLCKTKFPFEGEDATIAIDFTTELEGIVRRLRKAKKVDRYRTASASLKRYLEHLGSTIAETEENVRVLKEEERAEAEKAKKGSPAAG